MILTERPIFKKWAKPSLFLFSSLSNHNDNYSTIFDYKKRRWSAWDMNPGRQDGMHRQIH